MPAIDRLESRRYLSGERASRRSRHRGFPDGGAMLAFGRDPVESGRGWLLILDGDPRIGRSSKSVDDRIGR